MHVPSLKGIDNMRFKLVRRLNREVGAFDNSNINKFYSATFQAECPFDNKNRRIVYYYIGTGRHPKKPSAATDVTCTQASSILSFSATNNRQRSCNKPEQLSLQEDTGSAGKKKKNNNPNKRKAKTTKTTTASVTPTPKKKNNKEIANGIKRKPTVFEVFPTAAVDMSNFILDKLDHFTVELLREHFNTTMIDALNEEVTNNDGITEDSDEYQLVKRYIHHPPSYSTVLRWVGYLGFKRQLSKKCYYVDGHEYPEQLRHRSWITSE